MDTLWLLPALLLLIALAAPRYGVDSRNGSLWNPQLGPPDPPLPPASRRRSTPAADLRRVLQVVAAAKRRRPAGGPTAALARLVRRAVHRHP